MSSSIDGESEDWMVSLGIINTKPFVPTTNTIFLSNDGVFVSFNWLLIKLGWTFRGSEFNKSLTDLLYIIKWHSIVIVNSVNELFNLSYNSALLCSEKNSGELTIEWRSTSIFSSDNEFQVLYWIMLSL